MQWCTDGAIDESAQSVELAEWAESAKPAKGTVSAAAAAMGARPSLFFRRAFARFFCAFYRRL
jgi:hypothetical protein